MLALSLSAVDEMHILSATVFGERLDRIRSGHAPGVVWTESDKNVSA